MASRKQQHTTEALINFDVNRFINLEVERLYLQMSDRSFIQEHVFDPTMSAYNKIWDLATDKENMYNQFVKLQRKQNQEVKYTDVMDDGIGEHVNFQMENTLDARHRLYPESPCAKNGWTTPTPLPDMLMRFLPSGEEEDNE
ncbi:hypothetical protein Gotri_020912 [Gossypium trilobum]|uniref:Uncharacterized protein n=1 Tax=Gossypium trilobum TaxID=34281 RepID=A0A7J9DAT6_9ROSI|nr:hypothetical protein [Gossypium trilobum]